MIEITNGSQILSVTKGAYQSVYAPQGWQIRAHQIDVVASPISNDSKNKEVIPKSESDANLEPLSVQMDMNIAEPEVTDAEMDEDDIDLSEIPLSEMSVPQLKAYGNQLGIKVDTDSAKTLRNRIRKALEG